VAKEQRLVFGEVAELYDKARPSYPSALIDHLLTLIGPDQAGWCLDVGCGTGKASVLLAGRGLAGVGLEPDPDMAAMAERNLAPFPRWSVRVSDFEDYDFEDCDFEDCDLEDCDFDDSDFEGHHAGRSGPFDLISCAQAWHWLDPARRFTHAAELLRPGGWLALFWNRTGDDSSAIRGEIDGAYAALFPALSPHGALTAGRPPVGSPPPDAGFGPPSWQVIPWVRRYSTREWADLVQTHSDHRLLDPGQRQALLDRLAQVIDARGGFYDHPYECWLWTAQRTPATA